MKNDLPAELAALELEHECEAWDWARTAGVSAEELREALCDALRTPQRLPHPLGREGQIEL